MIIAEKWHLSDLTRAINQITGTFVYANFMVFLLFALGYLRFLNVLTLVCAQKPNVQKSKIIPVGFRVNFHKIIFIRFAYIYR